MIKRISDKLHQFWTKIITCPVWLKWAGILFLVNLSISLAGLSHHLTSSLKLLILLPIFFLIQNLPKLFLKLERIFHNSGGLITILFIVWLMHATLIFLPETGFDALWYHLPVGKLFINAGGFYYHPQLYQTVNPLFSDAGFYLGQLLAQGIGTKIMAFIYSSSAIAMVYVISKYWLSTKWALLVTIQASLFQVVAWQAGSFYVDMAKAFWELVAVACLINYQKFLPTAVKFVLGGLFLGAAAATKSFGLFLIVLMGGGEWRQKKSAWLWCWGLILPLMFAVYAWQQTGQFFPSLLLHTQKIAEIGNGSNLAQHISLQLISLPISPLRLLFSRDYISPLIVIFLPILLLSKSKKMIKADLGLQLLLRFSIVQWLIWWLIPPLSTRYAISGFLVILILLTVLSGNLISKSKKLINLAIAGYLLTSAVMIWPRLYVLHRSWPYLFGDQTQIEYLNQFKDGWIDVHLDSQPAL